MAILAIARNFDGEPNVVTIVTDDNLTAITTTGYWDLPATVDSVAALQNGAFQWQVNDLVVIKYAGAAPNFFTFDAVNHCFDALNPAAGLSDTLQSGNVFVGNSSNIATGVPMTGDIGISNTGVTAIQAGVIVNADISASAAIAFSKLASLTAASILVGNAGNVATAVSLSGAATISNTGVLTLNPIAVLGASGTASSLTMYPPSASNGFLQLLPVNAGGAFNTIISNGVMGQSTTYTIADIGASTGNLLVSKTFSKMWKGTASYAGGAAGPLTITVAGLPAGVGSATISSSTNAVSIAKADFSVAGQVTVTFSADPGAGTVINLIVAY